MTNKKELTKLIWAFSIGDGGLRYQSKKYKNAHYYLKQLDIHKDYVLWQKTILENICGTRLYEIENYVDKRGYQVKKQMFLITKNHPFFTVLRERIYNNGRKQIDPHYLKLLDWEVAAIMYQDNGWLELKEQKNNTYVRIGIATHAFTYGDNELLKKAFNEKLGINFNISRHKQKSGEYKWFLRTSKEQATKFIEGIKPYVFKSFEYKTLVERIAPDKG